MGPTASGKSAVALALARTLGGTELVYVDAMAVYRRMDIATAKPSAAERAEVPHHGIDLVAGAEVAVVVEAGLGRDPIEVADDVGLFKTSGVVHTNRSVI